MTERAAVSGASNRHYVARGIHLFEPILDEHDVPTGHAICNQTHDGVLCEVVTDDQ